MRNRIMRLGFVGVMLLLAGLSLMSSNGVAKAAPPAIPSMSMQGVGEAENQCRIARESCGIESNRCQAGYDHKVQLNNQCKARQDRQYQACYYKAYQARPPIMPTDPQQLAMWKRAHAENTCRRLKDTSRSCPKPRNTCYSHGYCTQQYQRCSSSAYMTDRTNQQSVAPMPEQRPAPYEPPKPPRAEPEKTSRQMSGLPWNRTKPKVYQVSIENTCKQPVRVAYARYYDGHLQVWGWQSLRPGTTKVNFSKEPGSIKIFLKAGKLAKVRARGKLTIFEPYPFDSFYVDNEQNFNIKYERYDRNDSSPEGADMRKVWFTLLAEGYWPGTEQFKIVKCKTKR